MTEGREQCRQMAVRAGARFLVVNCVCPERVVLARLRHRLKAFSFSDATAEVYLRMKRTFVEFERARYLLRVDTTLPTAKSVKRIEAALLRL
jgi:predicted kinase